MNEELRKYRYVSSSPVQKRQHQERPQAELQRFCSSSLPSPERAMVKHVAKEVLWPSSPATCFPLMGMKPFLVHAQDIILCCRINMGQSYIPIFLSSAQSTVTPFNVTVQYKHDYLSFKTEPKPYSHQFLMDQEFLAILFHLLAGCN